MIDRFARRTVKLTDAEVAEIERRKSNAAATRQIVKLKDDLKGVKYCLAMLVDKVKGQPQYNCRLLLKEERDRILAEIKGLEEGKQPKAGVGKP